MSNSRTAVESAIAELERLRKILRKQTAPQVRSSDERALAKATCYAWFESHKPVVQQYLGVRDFSSLDEKYKLILEASDRDGARQTYLDRITELKAELIALRNDCMMARPVLAATSDGPPDFSPLIGDPAMQKVLISRWEECVKCLGASAALAATVMMGGLLEALLLARINREKDKKALFTAKSAPKNSKTGAAKPLNEWMLNDFINVLVELRMITASAGAVGAVLRDYRNYVHPQKQLSHNVHLRREDADLFWEITKGIARQLTVRAS